jgi:4-hydroxy-2-oxoheptanedioate aldolase
VRLACDRHGVAPGIHCSNAAGVRQRIAEGFKFLAMASELRYMVAGLQQDLVATDWQPSSAGTIDAPSGGATVRY